MGDQEGEEEGEEEEGEGGLASERPDYDDEAGEEEEEAGEDREGAEADEEPAEAAGQAEDESPDKVEAPVIVHQPKKRKLINQFNFCERAALTYTNPTRVRTNGMGEQIATLILILIYGILFWSRVWRVKQFHRPDHSMAPMFCSGLSMIRTRRTITVN